MESALHGVETWTLRKEDLRRPEAFEMWVGGGRKVLRGKVRIKQRNLEKNNRYSDNIRGYYE